MQVSIETTSGLERRMTVRLPAERFETEVASRLQDAARRVKLPGFRPGKVPLKEVKRRFGPGVREEVAGELMQATVFEALAQESLRPAGRPRLEPLDLEVPGDFTYTAVFEVFPEFELADAARIEISRPVAEVTEADIDQMIERLREQRRSFEVRDGRAAETGDEVTLDFEGFIGDEAFQGGQAEDAKIVLGSGRMIPGFEEGLAGLHAGDNSSLEVTFPEDYGNEALRGKQARFEVTVKAVAEPVTPELDDAFFKEFGVEEGGLDAFRSEVRGNMERELRKAIRTRLKNQVMDGLAAIHELMLPESMVGEEIHRMQHEMVQQFGGKGMDPHSLPAELFRDNAERRVKLGLVLSRIVEVEKVEADPERVEAILDDVAAPYGEPEQVKSWYHANAEQMQQIRSAAIEDQVVDLILERATVTDEPGSYDSVLAAAQGRGAAADGAEEADPA
ncbi:MAG: trigger factor [Pseudomonadales bacterium]|jgi:trigger factor|nr:trigger factor [Pseudomonadales bacterium]